jgi:hypothetical protein
MRRLAAHTAASGEIGSAAVVFDIDSTILTCGTWCRAAVVRPTPQLDWFHGLTADDVTVHENQVDQLLRDMAPCPVAERAYRWYLERRWQRGRPRRLARTRACST